MESRITSKGQTTIPKAIREQLGLKAGDKIRFFSRPDGQVVMLPVVPATRLRGLRRRPGPPVTLEEMDEAIAAGAAGASPQRGP